MEKQRKNNLYGSALLMLCAIIWGSSFVAQTTGAEHVGPFTFIAMRSLLGALSLSPVALVTTGIRKKKNGGALAEGEKKLLLKGGLMCGVVLCVASSLQQLGIDGGTAPGKAAFITALYILLVPIASVFIGKKVRPLIWPCVIVSIIALYLLCITEAGSFAFSDFYVLLCAICYTVHILVIDKVSPRVDGVSLSLIQFLVAGVIAAIPMVLFEAPTLDSLIKAAPSIAYSGIMSSGVAYTLQILGQQKTEPTIATMIMSLESVFGVLTAMVILHQVPTLREGIGCVLMFAAIIVAQLPEKKKTA